MRDPAAADLGAGANRRPGIDHAAPADARPDVHVTGHHDRALLDMRPVAHDARRDHAEITCRPLGRDLVEEPEIACRVDLALRQAEEQVDRLLDPAVDRPARRSLLRDAQRALIEPVDHLAHGIGVAIEGGRVPLSLLHGRAQGLRGRLGEPQLCRSGILHAP